MDELNHAVYTSIRHSNSDRIIYHQLSCDLKKQLPSPPPKREKLKTQKQNFI